MNYIVFDIKKMEENLKSDFIELPIHNTVEERASWLMEMMKKRSSEHEYLHELRMKRRLEREGVINEMNFKKYRTLVDIAQECHTKNNELMMMNGEEQNGNWDSLDRHTKFINLKSVIKALENPDLTAKDMHDEWMNNKIADGWKFGDVKDPELKTHPLIIDYDLMKDVDKMKDQIFIDVCNKYREIYDSEENQ